MIQDYSMKNSLAPQRFKTDGAERTAEQGPCLKHADRICEIFVEIIMEVECPGRKLRCYGDTHDERIDECPG